jgi:hypothetical protein
MRLPNLDPLGANAVDETVVDDVVRRRFGVEPQDDPSGLDGSRSPLPPGEPDEDAQFEAYLRRYFPGSVA